MAKTSYQRERSLPNFDELPIKARHSPSPKGSPNSRSADYQRLEKLKQMAKDGK